MNLDGSVDLRQFGPFNVERTERGQLAPPGTVKNPINKYPDSKTKYRRSDLSPEEYENRPQSSK